MKEKMLREYYMKAGADDGTASEAVEYVLEMERRLQSSGTSCGEASEDDVKNHVDVLIHENRNTFEALVALLRYFYLIGNHKAYIYLTRLLGGTGVMENIKKRIDGYAGRDTAERIFLNVVAPALGTPIEKMPEYTDEVLSGMKKEMPAPLMRKALAGNNHGIPAESMLDEKRLFNQASDLDGYLADRHRRKVNELQKHCDTGKIWFEQEITQEIVDYVNGNQEILSAVRKGDKLYVTKIPYDGVNYLSAESPDLKRYYACHCPFVREAILDGNVNIDPDWCYCSAGFAKFPFEQIFETELEVRVLESVLKGDPVCRFEISLPPSIDRSRMK